MILKIIITLFLLTVSLYSAEYAVVIDKKSDITKVSLKQIKDIFIMKRHFINSKKIVPVNMPSTSQLRIEFEKKVLKISREKLNRHWTKQHFQGVSPPVVQSSNNSMKLFIKNVKGAIGYIPVSSIDSDLKVLYEF